MGRPRCRQRKGSRWEGVSKGKGSGRHPETGRLRRRLAGFDREEDVAGPYQISTADPAWIGASQSLELLDVEVLVGLVDALIISPSKEVGVLFHGSLDVELPGSKETTIGTQADVVSYGEQLADTEGVWSRGRGRTVASNRRLFLSPFLLPPPWILLPSNRFVPRAPA